MEFKDPYTQKRYDMLEAELHDLDLRIDEIEAELYNILTDEERS